MTDEWLRLLGATGLPVSRITIGAGTFGNRPGPAAIGSPDATTVSLVRAVLDSPFRSLDTANIYGRGASEQQIGYGLAAHGGIPEDFLVITKVDPRDRDYSADRVRASVRESQLRLGLASLPLVHLHDPEYFDFAAMTAPGGPIDALRELKAEGAVQHLGLAGGPTAEMARYLDLGVFEVLLVHSRFTLVDRSADSLIGRAAAAGLGVFNAAVFGGGLLAGTPTGSTTYGYRPAGAATLEAVEHMRQLCRRWDADLATAALQFSLRDPRIHSTVVGISRRERLQQLQASSVELLPSAFWAELEDLVPAREHWLGAE